MTRIILKSSMGTTKKSSFLLHVTSVTRTLCVVLAMRLAGEFTTFMVPPSFVTSRPRCLVSSFEMKLYVAPVSSKACTTWPLMVALTNMSHLLVGANRWLLSAPRHWRVPMLCWGSSVDGVKWSLSCSARVLSNFFFKQSRTQCGPLHMKHELQGLGGCFYDLLYLLLRLGGFFCPQSFLLWSLFFRPFAPHLPWLGLLSLGWAK